MNPLKPLLLALGLFLGSVVQAATVEVSGAITIPYRGKLFTARPSGKESDQALQEAKLQVWELYTSRFSAAKYQQYLPLKDQFTSDLDAYVLNVQVLDEEVNKKAARIALVVSATINETAVDAMLGSLSSAGQQASGEGSYFTFVFAARQAVSAKTKDAKRVDMSLTESVSTAEETFAVDSQGANESASTSTLEKRTTGGSTVTTATQRQYQILSSQDIDSAMSAVLTTAGFEIVNYGDVVSACGGAEPEQIDAEYRDQDEMSRETRSSAIAAARDCEVPLFATGTVDVGVQDTNPKTGNKRVFVSVRGQVWNIEKRLPKRVASVGPVQFSGEGPDDQVAMRNALNVAASEAAKAIVEQLNLKAIR